MKEYQQRDLGYPRAATSARMRIEMPDGSVWSVPVQAIVDDRDESYAHDKEDTIGFIRDDRLDAYEVKDWAANNMNWDDVSEYARKEETHSKPCDFQEGWMNGDKAIDGDL